MTRFWSIHSNASPMSAFILFKVSLNARSGHWEIVWKIVCDSQGSHGRFASPILFSVDTKSVYNQCMESSIWVFWYPVLASFSININILMYLFICSFLRGLRDLSRSLPLIVLKSVCRYWQIWIVNIFIIFSDENMFSSSP